MKPEMSKIIVERRRLGGCKPKGMNKGIRDLEDLPQRESMKKHYTWCGKELNENLAPLDRYLHSQVGRPWDKVYSEICEHIKLDSPVQLHILQHLEWMIETKTFLGNDGKVYVRSGRGDYPIEEDSWWSRQDLYVHPVTRLIAVVKRRKRKPESKQPPQTVEVGRFGQYHKINGIWYLVSLAEYRSPLGTIVKHDKVPLEIGNKRKIYVGGNCWHLTEEGRRADIILGKSIGNCVQESGLVWQDELVKLYGRKGVYGTAKRQLNSKELRKAALRNG